MRNTRSPRRCGLYVRISKYDGTEERSEGTLRQERDTRAEADQRGWLVVDTYVDDDRSAYSGKPRPAYQRLCDDLKNGVIDAVIVWHTDRLHRSPRELEDFVTLIEVTGAEVVSVTGGDYDLDTSDGRFKARIMGSVAVKESEDKSRRLRRMHAEKVSKGEPNGGGRPYGYQRDRVTPEPLEALIVAEVVERIAAGQTLTAIANDLNARGVPTARGARWTLGNVRRMALNPRYIGHRTHHGADAGEAKYDALVDEATWRRANALLRDPSRPQRRTARRYLLGGSLIFCGKCGEPLRSKQSHSRNGTVPVYACRPRTQGGCGGVTVRADAVEQLVAAYVVDTVESAAFAKSLRSRTGGDRKAAAEVTRIAAELDELEEAKRTGALSLREYIKFRDATAARLGDAQARMAGDTTAGAVGRFAGQTGALRAWWDAPTTSLDQRQAVVRAVIERVVVDPVGKGSGNRFDTSRVRIDPAV